MHAPLRDEEILARRGPKNRLDPRRPYAYLVEPEPAPGGPPGRVEDVATIFLTNRECPFRCLMCDLWRNTTDETVPLGAIPEQIAWALERLPETPHLKLYNNGNFFDRGAVPADDHAAIAARCRGFRTVIVENHPRLCTQALLPFRDRLAPARLEVALGLETAHEELLARLNKRMTVDDFRRAAAFLSEASIRVRAFILLRPPFLSRAAGVEWALRSIEIAFAAGVECCAVIPTRTGNGIMEDLAAARAFAPPTVRDMESVLEEGLALAGSGRRVLVDLWDGERFQTCRRCGPARLERLQAMNLAQRVLPAVLCDCPDPA